MAMTGYLKINQLLLSFYQRQTAVTAYNHFQVRNTAVCIYTDTQNTIIRQSDFAKFYSRQSRELLQESDTPRSAHS